MSICPHPWQSGPTGPPGRRLGAGLDLSPSIPLRSKRLELGLAGGGCYTRSASSAVELGVGQMGNVGSNVSASSVCHCGSWYLRWR